MAVSNKAATGEEARAILRTLLPQVPIHRFIEDLFTAGFIVVPMPYRKPARRGNKPKPYTGPAMIGQSHTARLVGGAS